MDADGSDYPMTSLVPAIKSDGETQEEKAQADLVFDHDVGQGDVLQVPCISAKFVEHLSNAVEIFLYLGLSKNWGIGFPDILTTRNFWYLVSVDI